MEHQNLTGRFFNTTSNTSSILSCTGLSPSKFVQIVTYSSFMFFSLIGNVFIVAAFYIDKTLTTNRHYFIVNMAISDLIIPVIHLPWQISTVYHDYRWTIDGIVGTFLCKVVKNAWEISITVSILSMVGMAVDRFHGILFAMKPALMSRKKCLLVIIVSWLSSVALRAHYIYATRLVQYHNGRGLRCRHQWETPQKTKEVDMLTWISLLSLSMLSAIVLSSLYSSIVVWLLVIGVTA